MNHIAPFLLTIYSLNFPLLSFLSDGNAEVKDERCPFIRAVLRQFTGEELRNDVGKLSYAY